METSGALLAAVLMQMTPAVPAVDRDKVLATYQDKGYISVDGQIGEPAEAVVVIAGTPYVDRDATEKNEAMVTVVAQFDTAAPIVLAGTGVAGEGNTVAEVRRDPALNKTISTVDNVQTAQGRIATVMALAEQLRFAALPDAQTKAGHYGNDADTLLPKRSS